MLRTYWYFRVFGLNVQCSTVRVLCHIIIVSCCTYLNWTYSYVRAYMTMTQSHDLVLLDLHLSALFIAHAPNVTFHAVKPRSKLECLNSSSEANLMSTAVNPFFTFVITTRGQRAISRILCCCCCCCCYLPL